MSYDINLIWDNMQHLITNKIHLICQSFDGVTWGNSDGIVKYMTPHPP